MDQKPTYGKLIEILEDAKVEAAMKYQSLNFFQPSLVVNTLIFQLVAQAAFWIQSGELLHQLFHLQLDHPN